MLLYFIDVYLLTLQKNWNSRRI